MVKAGVIYEPLSFTSLSNKSFMKLKNFSYLSFPTNPKKFHSKKIFCTCYLQTPKKSVVNGSWFYGKYYFYY